MTFFNKQAKATKLDDWKQFGLASPCPPSLMFPWQALFDKSFFSQFL